jgi:hypothetical protein
VKKCYLAAVYIDYELNSTRSRPLFSNLQHLLVLFIFNGLTTMACYLSVFMRNTTGRIKTPKIMNLLEYKKLDMDAPFSLSITQNYSHNSETHKSCSFLSFLSAPVSVHTILGQHRPSITRGNLKESMEACVDIVSDLSQRGEKEKQ